MLKKILNKLFGEKKSAEPTQAQVILELYDGYKLGDPVCTLEYGDCVCGIQVL